MNITTRTAMNLMRVYSYNKPFYADDFGMNGGEIQVLRSMGFIKPTGNVKKKTLKIPLENDGNAYIVKECNVKEWKVNHNFYAESLKLFWTSQAIDEAKALLELANELGLEGN